MYVYVTREKALSIGRGQLYAVCQKRLVTHCRAGRHSYVIHVSHKAIH